MGDKTRAPSRGLIQERINQALFLVVVLPLTGLLIYLHQFFIALSFPLGAAYGIWLVTPHTPHVELKNSTCSESQWCRGPLWLRPIGYLLYFYYYPLGLVLRRWDISHTPAFGALIIYSYTWWLPALVLLATGWRPYWLLNPDLHVGLFIGLALAHLFHIVEDRLFNTR